MEEEKRVDSDGLGVVSQEVFDPATGVCREAKDQQIVNQDVWDDGVKGRGVIHKQHPDVAVPVFQVFQGSVEDDGNGVICGPVGSVSKLMVVQGWREAGFNVLAPVIQNTSL